MIKTLPLFALAFVTIPTLAQDLEEVLATGSRISSYGYGAPSVRLVRSADFMTQSVELINDNWSPEGETLICLKPGETLHSDTEDPRRE